jgi:hypothetical protein
VMRAFEMVGLIGDLPFLGGGGAQASR